MSGGDVLVIDLRQIAQHHQLGVSADATDDRLQLKLGQTLRLINNNIGPIKERPRIKFNDLN